VKGVEREHAATRFATDYLLNDIRIDPTKLGRNLRLRDVNESAKHLEGTYTIRLYAEFETALRAFWSGLRNTELRTRDLLNGIGALRKVPDDLIQSAHAVCEYRNALVHARYDSPQPIPIKAACSDLCCYLNFLPLEW